MTDHITRLKEALEAVHQSKRRFCAYDSEAARSRAEDAIEAAMEEFSEAANPAAIRELLEKLEQAEKDARRYRYLRQFGKSGFLLQYDPRRDAHGRGAFVTSVPHSGPGDCTPEKLDAAVDAAIASQEGGRENG